MMTPPGDFSSDAKFFVFTGINNRSINHGQIQMDGEAKSRIYVSWTYLYGDFTSLSGVISFLGSAALLVLYVFFDKIYSGDDKRIPLMVNT